jgi:membrane fusion protein (multidrug efflux system)
MIMKTEERVAITRIHNNQSHEPQTVVAPNGTLKETAVDQLQQTGTAQRPRKSLIRRLMPWVLLAILGAGALYGWNIVQFNRVHESTDDAQIDADISPVIARLPAYIARITVEENQAVKAGDVLATLDAKDLEIKQQSAEAAYQNAVAAVASARATAAAASAKIKTVDVAAQKTSTDLDRDERLLTGNAITEQQMLATRSAHESAVAELAAARQQATAVQSQIAVAEAQASQRKSDLDNVKLQLSYATIVAPVDGTVAKRNVEAGQFVQSGQPIMAIAPHDVWITANFKETQIAEIKKGAPVTFEADAYPDFEFHGTVSSIAPATGAKFSLLPPDNASGNFVKVTQRIPVRIHVDDASVKAHPLRPGMSVDVTVTTGR